MNLISELIQGGWLKTEAIIGAFQTIKRVDFLPENIKDLAEANEALPIGFNQTISQPLTVAFMLELLKPQPGDKILDIGSGSGWTSALLARIVSGGKPKSKSMGKVIAIEVVPELKTFGERNVARYNFIEKGIVEFICADGSKGYPDIASRSEFTEGFDKILCSAAVQIKVPEAWLKQLKIGGRMVLPIGTSIWLFIKNSPRQFDQFEYPGFAFVPLIEQ